MATRRQLHDTELKIKPAFRYYNEYVGRVSQTTAFPVIGYEADED